MHFILLIIAALFGIFAFTGFISGETGVGIFFSLLLAGICYLDVKYLNWKTERAARKLQKKRQQYEELVVQPDYSSTPPPFPATQSRRAKKQKPAQWIPVGSTTKIGSYQIPGGIYLGTQPDGWGAEPSTIDPNHKIGTPLEPHILTASYYPSYSDLLPNERATYLWWLQELVRGSYPPTLQKGYLFIHFYGFERRVLLDDDLSASNTAAVRMLLEKYGPLHQNSTFVSYLGDFLNFADYKLGLEEFRIKWPQNLLFQNGRTSENSLSLILANLFQRSEPLPPELAYLIASQHDKSRNSVVTKRASDQFRDLFITKFKETHPDGITLKAAKRETSIQYHPANRSLFAHIDESYGVSSKLSLRAPNILGLKSQFKVLPIIWNECIDELSGYSRAIHAVLKSPDPSLEAQLKAHLALPETIRKTEDHPLRDSFQELISVSEKDETEIVLPASSLATLTNVAERATLTAKQSLLITELSASLGYSCAPHPAHMDLPLKWDQELLLSENQSELDTACPHLKGVLRLLYLTVMVAAADGEVSDSEMSHFLDALKKFNFTAPQENEIKLTMRALQRDPKIAVRNLNKIAKGIPENQRDNVLSHLVNVASDDDIITPDELKILKRIAKAMSLPPESLDEILAKQVEFKTVEVISGNKARKKGEAIPPRATTPAPGFSLDPDKIASISKETDDVVSRLVEVLSTEEEPSSPSVESIPNQPKVQSPDWLGELESAYHQPLQELLAHPSPEASTLEEVATRHHLIASSFVDEINEWADEALGDFLIEFDQNNTFIIYKDLIPAA